MIHTQNQMFKQGLTKPIRNFFTYSNGSCHNLLKVINTPICCCLLFSGASLITVLFRLYTSTNPLTLLTGIKGHIEAKWVPRTQPDNEGIDSPINTVWISSVQCTVGNEKTHKTSHTGNVIPGEKKTNKQNQQNCASHTELSISPL